MMTGMVVGGYRILSLIGEGESGLVYLAEHPTIGRRAAIKFLRPELTAHARRLDEVITEVSRAAALRHPNIVDIVDVGKNVLVMQPDGSQVALSYVVMGLLEGESLAKRLERDRRVSIEAAVSILAQAASAVAAAHDAGLAHGFLAPSNVFLCNLPDYPDFVRILDFGTASLKEGTSPRSVTERRGDDVTSLGLLCYQMLSGYRPDLITRPVPPLVHELRPDVPMWLSKLVAKTLDRKSGARWTNARELRTALQTVEAAGEGSLRKEGGPATEAGRVLKIGSLSNAEVDLPVGPRLSLSTHEAGTIVEGFPPPPMTEPPPSLSRVMTVAVPPAPAARAPTPAVPLPAPPPPISVAAVEVLPEDVPPHVNEDEQSVANQARMVKGTIADIIARRLRQQRLQLPTMPRVALRCLEMLRDRHATFASLAEVISEDPVMTTRILRLVNSAAFSRRQVVTRLEQAVGQLGFSALRLAVVEMSAAEVFLSRNDGIRTRFKVVWEHCLAVALLAQDISSITGGRTDPGDAYVVGLLHDIGKPVVGVLLLEAERQLRKEAEASWMSELVWERTVLESHRQVGAVIADQWRLPEAVVSAIRDLSAYEPLAGKSCQNVVRYANALAKREGIYLGPVDIDEVEVAVQEGRHFLGVTVQQEQGWIQALRRRTEGVTTRFK